MSNPSYQDLNDGITCIDAQYIRSDFVACYLVQQGDEVALIDSGGYLSVPGILSVLESKDIAYHQVKHIILTHVHLDHAGGAGELIKHLPNADVCVHERGANHLIDPTKLRTGVIAVYGEVFFKQFIGDLLPIDQAKIRVIGEGDCLTLGDRTLRILDTPGHALHHVCIWDEVSGGIFSGDTLGVSYRDFDHDQGVLIFPPTSPVQFDPDAWLNTINRLSDLEPTYAYLTHYGRIEFNREVADMLKHHITEFSNIARSLKHERGRHQALKEQLLSYLLTVTDQHNVSLTQDKQIKLLKGDLEICAQGLGVWLDRQD